MKNSVKHQYKRTQQSIVLFVVAVSLALISATAFASTNIPAFLDEQVDYASPVGELTLTGIQLIDPSGKCSSVSVTVAGKVTGTTDDGGGKDVITFQLWDDGTLKDSGDISVPVGQTIDFSVTLDFAGLYGHSAPGVGVYSSEVGLRVDPFYPTDRAGTCGGVLTVAPTNRDVGKDAGTTTFSVSNTGTGDMPWTAEVLLGDTWLSITSGASGTNAGTVTCAFAANTGTTVRTGTILLTSVGATGSPQKVTVIQDPGKQIRPPALLVDPINRDVEHIEGTTSFNVSNTGDGKMPWSAKVSDGAWLSIKSGNIGDGAGTITCEFDANTSTSDRTGKILVTAPGAKDSPQEVTVKQAGLREWTISGNVKTSSSVLSGVKIIFSGGRETTTDSSGNYRINVPDGYSGAATPSKTGFTFKPASRDYSKVTASKIDEDYLGSDDGNPILKVTPVNRDVEKDAGTSTFSVSNDGTGNMQWSAKVVSDGTWLSIKSGASGSNAGTITCAFDANTGTTVRTGTILVTAVGAAASPQRVTVTQKPIDPPRPVLKVDPTNRDVEKDAGTTTFGVSNTGTGDMPWTAVVSDGAWLSIKSGASGSNAGIITCAFGANTGTTVRTGTILVTAAGATGSPQKVTVTQKFDPTKPILKVDPANRDVENVAGTTTFGVSNTGTGDMPWTAVVSDGAWLSIKSGTSGSNAGTITCAFGANTGTTVRTGTILVTAVGATGSPQRVTVTQKPGDKPPALSITPTNRDVEKDAGTSTFSVSNDGAGDMPWTAEVSDGTRLSIESGSSGTGTGTITFAFDANTSTSVRIGKIKVTAAGATGSPQEVTVKQAGLKQWTVSGNVTKYLTTSSAVVFGVKITFSSGGGETTTDSNGNYSVIVSEGYSGTATPSKAGFTFKPAFRNYTNVTANKTGEDYVASGGNIVVGSNSIEDIDVVKITDMSGSLPAGGGAVTVRAWDKDGKELSEAGSALPITVSNHGTTSIQCADLEHRFLGGVPAAYTFLVESPKMFITNVNNSFDMAVKVPIIFTNGLSDFASNSIGSRNTIKVTDMSGTIGSSGVAITITAWDKDGKAIPESTSAVPLKLYNHGTTSINGSSIPARFPTGTPMTYEFTIASPKLIVSNVKNSTDGTLNIPTVYTIGISEFVSNSVGSRNTIYISDFSGALAIGGAAINVRAWDASGKEIPESDISSYKIYNFETVKITGAELISRFSSGSPMAYEFTVDSPNVVITNIKSSTDNSINIPTVYTRGITKYTTNYVSDYNTIQITDMSGDVLSGGAITISARDGDGRIIPEAVGTTALKLVDHGTTTIEGNDLKNRFPGGVPVTYEFSIGSSSVVVTNLTKSTDGTINIPTVFTLGPNGGI